MPESGIPSSAPEPASGEFTTEQLFHFINTGNEYADFVRILTYSVSQHRNFFPPLLLRLRGALAQPDRLDFELVDLLVGATGKAGTSDDLRAFIAVQSEARTVLGDRFEELSSIFRKAGAELGQRQPVSLASTEVIAAILTEQLREERDARGWGRWLASEPPQIASEEFPAVGAISAHRPGTATEQVLRFLRTGNREVDLSRVARLGESGYANFFSGLLALAWDELAWPTVLSKDPGVFDVLMSSLGKTGNQEDLGSMVALGEEARKRLLTEDRAWVQNRLTLAMQAMNHPRDSQDAARTASDAEITAVVWQQLQYEHDVRNWGRWLISETFGAPFELSETPAYATTWLNAQFAVNHEPGVAEDLLAAGRRNRSGELRLARFRPRFGPRLDDGIELYEDLGRLQRTFRPLLTGPMGVARFRAEQAFLPALLEDIRAFIADANLTNPWIDADVTFLATGAERLADVAQSNYERPVQEWEPFFLRQREDFNDVLARVALYVQVAAERGTPYQICNGLLAARRERLTPGLANSLARPQP